MNYDINITTNLSELSAYEEDNHNEICGLCGEDLYGEPLVTPEGFKSHYTCYAIELTKQNFKQKYGVNNA